MCKSSVLPVPGEKAKQSRGDKVFRSHSKEALDWQQHKHKNTPRRIRVKLPKCTVISE